MASVVLNQENNGEFCKSSSPTLHMIGNTMIATVTQGIHDRCLLFDEGRDMSTHTYNLTVILPVFNESITNLSDSTLSQKVLFNCLIIDE